MNYNAIGTAGVLAGLAWACLGGLAVAQEGTGDPVFTARRDEVQSVFPAAAKAKGLDGEATVTCQAAQKRIWACALTSETPAGQGFGEAALALIGPYQVTPPKDQASVWSRAIVIPFVAPKARVVHVGGAEYTTPLQMEGPSRDALYAAWPRAARFSGVEGIVDLRCTVTLEGRVKDCVVLAQHGNAQDLGPAALSVTPLYRFQPGRKNGAPVPMSILVKAPFVCDYRCRPFEGADSQPRQAWRAAPSQADVLAAYPPSARERGVEGLVRLDCMADAAGQLNGCRVVAESVKGEGFGAAALGLTKAFRLPPREVASAPPASRGGIGAAMLGGLAKPSRLPASNAVAEPVPVGLTIAFEAQVGAPQWTRGQYLPAALASDGKSTVRGEARARCSVGASGGLEMCEMLRVEPADPAVEREARKGLDTLKVQLWTDEGRPTIGASVVFDVPVGQFKLPSIIAAEVDLPRVGPGVVDYQPLIHLADPGPDDMSRYYPERAQRMEVQGKVELSCANVVRRNPNGCTVVSETPLEYGFGDAALKMSRLFRFSPETIDGVPTDEPIQIPVAFTVPR